MNNTPHIKFALLAIIALLLCTTVLLSCKKEQDPHLLVANATVINAGSPEADGCGWLLKLDTVYYSPKNLPEKFKVADAKVAVGYYLLNTKFQCGLAANLKYTQIDIKDIKNR